ncbi:13489_t:CDS:1, partial [Dentiscutata heterogama]
MDKCSSCNNHYPHEAFMLNRKKYKTCATCLIKKAEKRAKKKALPDDNNVNIPEVILLEDLSEYFAGLTDNLENNMGLYFTVQVDIADMPIL